MQFSNYIYIKQNPDWEPENKVKYGYVWGGIENIINRLMDSTEEHSEHSTMKNIYNINKNKGYLLRYKEIDKIFSLIASDANKIKIVEEIYSIQLPLLRELHNHLVKSNTKKSNEFINSAGLELIDRIIKEEFPLLGLDLVKEWTEEEVEEVNRRVVVQAREQVKKDHDSLLTTLADVRKKKPKILKYTPNDIQQSILKHICAFYEVNDIGKLIAACGTGKSLAGLFISERLDAKTILIGVPYSNLLDQWEEEVKKIYPNCPILKVGGSGTTNTDEIKTFINLSHRCIIITTYASSHTLGNVTDELNFTFDFKIGDEAHHLASAENPESKKQWIMFHKIVAAKTLFMTATEKFIENKTNKIVYSMEDESIFGKLIHLPISIKWAIDNKKITDYRVVLLKNTEEQVDDIMRKIGLPDGNKELFISAYVSLKTILKYPDLTHILIYCNKTDNATLIINYIKFIIEKEFIVLDKDTFYYNDYHSKSKDKINSRKLFEQSTYGILSCVYELGEGTNMPELNGVVFAENMESDIRITQCSLRANRLNKHFPNKLAYYIIPWIDTDDWEEDGVPFEKVKKIISKLGNEDDTISQKIVLSEIKNNTKKPKKPVPGPVYDDLNLVDNDSELNKIKLRLRYKRALKSRCSEEEDELNLVRDANKSLNILDKHQYVAYKKKHSHYIVNPDSYFKQHAVWKGWYDFLGIDIKQFIQNKDEWITFCKEKNITSVDMYNKLCVAYPKLPKEPCELYIGFTNIGNELGLFNRRR